MRWLATLRKHPYEFLPLLIFAWCFITVPGYAQTKGQKTSSYELLPAPDLWFNSVDGARIGIRLKGQVPGTFNDGPHRLNVGFWVGTKRPKIPVSYYLSFLEPINSWSDFGEEASVQLFSSVRTGFTHQGIAVNKRWQNGFDDSKYQKLKVYFHTEKLFDKSYQLFPWLWNQNWLTMLTFDYQLNNVNHLGKYLFKFELTAGVPNVNTYFEQIKGEYQQEIILGYGFQFRGRAFLGLSTNTTPLQMQFMTGLDSPENWLGNGFTRARGTIPPVWLKEGWIQYGGGPNLRGYANSNFKDLFNHRRPIYPNMGSINMEMIYPNPITHALSKIEFIGDLLKFHSYVFFDSGGIFHFSGNPVLQKPLSDSGAGFTVSFSFPDNAGSMKKVTIRYDVPFWLSNPAGNSNWKYRNVLALSAIISI